MNLNYNDPLMSIFEDLEYAENKFMSGWNLLEYGKRPGNTNQARIGTTYNTKNAEEYHEGSNAAQFVSWLALSNIEKMMKDKPIIIAGSWIHPVSKACVDVEVKFLDLRKAIVSLITDAGNRDARYNYQTSDGRTVTDGGLPSFSFNKQKQFTISAAAAKEICSRVRKRLESEGFKYAGGNNHIG